MRQEGVLEQGGRFHTLTWIVFIPVIRRFLMVQSVLDGVILKVIATQTEKQTNKRTTKRGLQNQPYFCIPKLLNFKFSGAALILHLQNMCAGYMCAQNMRAQDSCWSCPH